MVAMTQDRPQADRLRDLVRWAILAPSSHNIQPWRFRIDDRGIDLRLDTRRTLPVADPAGRELRISCGAALFHLRLAARCDGMEPAVTVLPDGPSGDRLARLDIVGTAEPTGEERDLSAAIPVRRTIRGRFAPGPVHGETAAQLAVASAAEGAWFHSLEGERRAEVLTLIEAGDRRQFADPAFRCELARWINTAPHRRADGIPARTLGIPGLLSPLAPLLIRHLGGDRIAARDRDLATTAPVLGVLTTDEDGPADWLTAGQALARLLLTGTLHGMAAAYMNGVVQCPDLRVRLAALANRDEAPQILLRLGPAPPMPPCPRRPPDQVLD